MTDIQQIAARLNAVMDTAESAQKVADKSATVGLAAVADALADTARSLRTVAEILLEHEDRHHIETLAQGETP